MKSKPGTIVSFTAPYWAVRYGPGITDLVYLRPQDFVGVTPLQGFPVELRYVSTHTQGLWKAYPSKV